jgi:glycosyltransferase involved in cell wall biosynthesis
MTKVLMYGWEFPPYISGGLGIACHDLTKALSEIGTKITFVLPTLQGKTDTNLHLELLSSSDHVIEETQQKTLSYEEFKERMDIIGIESTLRPYFTEKSYQEFIERLINKGAILEDHQNFYKLSLTGQYGPDLISEVFRYAYVAGKIAAKVEHEVIHTHDWLTFLAGVEAKRISGKPLICHVHALETDRSGINVNQQIYEIEKMGLHEADKIIAVSFLTKNNIVNYYGIDPNKIEVVHNAVSKHKSTQRTEYIKKTPDEKLVLFLGRITFQKGPDYFIEAAAKVLKEFPKARFVVAGSGDMMHRLIERTAELKIGRNIHFTGFLKRPEVEELFASSDLYVMSSVSEPFGISCLEAILFDVPVIISKQSGVSEVLSNALKVDFWDVDELANKILNVLTHPALSKELQAQSSEELKHIQWEKSATKVEDIYKKLVPAHSY